MRNNNRGKTRIINKLLESPEEAVKYLPKAVGRLDTIQFAAALAAVWDFITPQEREELILEIIKEFVRDKLVRNKRRKMDSDEMFYTFLVFAYSVARNRKNEIDLVDVIKVYRLWELSIWAKFDKEYSDIRSCWKKQKVNCPISHQFKNKK